MAIALGTQENPLEEGLLLRRTPDPCAIVIFGASGDLTHKKLMPALYSLMFRQLLPQRFAIIGVARSEADDDEFRNDMKEAVQKHARDEFRQDVWDQLAQNMHYIATDFGDDDGEVRLQDLLVKLDDERQLGGNRVYYLAVPPAAFPTIVDALGRQKTEKGWTRLIVEKPFGHDLQSAEALNAMLWKHFEEKEIFRIDHYLGKETVQNMNALRFANGIFEPIWNRQFIDHVQITVAESIGIEGRASYYEQAGAVRDIFQNHLLQLLALTAMEPPIDFTAESVRNEKVKVLKALHTPGPKSVVRGQYGRGFVEGEEVVAYREEQGVAPDSMTDTYVAAKLFVDNWRWADTPFYVRMGKRLARRETTIAIQFKRAPHPPFGEVASEGLRPNVLLVHVQPDEGVSLAIGAKVPGQGMTIRTVHMDFLYGGAFRTGLPEAYERLILDTLLGDGTLFTRSDEVEEQWLLVDSIVAAWQRDRPSFPNYAAGTWGPPSADDLIPPGRPIVETQLSAPALVESWNGSDVRLGAVERALAELRAATATAGGPPNIRTSVMTHIAWVPEEWRDQARNALAGMAERHPSRTILLDPRPDSGRNCIDATVTLECYTVPGSDRNVCSEIVELELHGMRAKAPASVVEPMLISDLPVFIRWRGEPPWGSTELDQMVRVVDRLIVDSTEWDDLPYPYRRLVELFDRTAVSDIAWSRTARWREHLATLWPGIDGVGAIRVHGTTAQAYLLAGWLRSRLGRDDIALEIDEHDRLEGIDIDGAAASFPPGDPPSPSDVLSEELDRFTRDPVYEAAVRAAIV